MASKTRFFIYDRKEMGILILLAGLVALFAFTLGIHLGKRVAPMTAEALPSGEKTNKETPVAETIEEKVPEKQELNEQARSAPKAADETATAILHEEVERTGIHLSPARQVRLPEKSKSPEAGATTLKNKTEKVQPQSQAQSLMKAHFVNSILAGTRPAPLGKYTLQVGSHNELKEAEEQVSSLESLAMKPFLRSVDLGNKGKWFRVYLGGYTSKEEAVKAGSQYKTANMINSFVVANMVN